MTQRSLTLVRVIYTMGSWSAAACGSDTSEPLQTVQDEGVVALSTQPVPDISAPPAPSVQPEPAVVTPQIQAPPPAPQSKPTPDLQFDPTPAPSAAVEPASPPQADATPQCQRGNLEPDLFVLPLDGAGVSLFGALERGQYVLSTTYLRLQDSDAAGSKFWELMGSISEDLGKREGLVAHSLGLSLACNTARTLSVWRDDVAMLEFVTGSAHGAAVAASSQLSRGGSVVMHWAGDETQATWKVAAQKLAEYDGPTL